MEMKKKVFIYFETESHLQNTRLERQDMYISIFCRLCLYDCLFSKLSGMDQTIAPYIANNNSMWVFYCKLEAFMNHSIKTREKKHRNFIRPTFTEANKKYKNMFTENSQCF